MAFLTETEKQFKQDILSYNACKDIYRTSVMGKRVVEALVNFSLSAEREISIQKAPPEALERFNITAKQMQQKEAIKRTIYNARIYGTGALYVALHHINEDKDDFETKPNFNNAGDFEIFFNVLDPQNISGSVVDNNPLSSTFLQLIDIKVDNQIVPRKRIAVSHAVEPLYLDQRTSLIPYSPPSVFYNMIDLLKDYDASIEALDNLLYKAGAIIYKYPNQKFSGIILDAVKKSAEILEQKRNGAVIAITEKCTVEDFPINNVNGLIESVNKLEDAITKALNDTPASLLFDKPLNNGFSEGDKDKETEISIIEAFRENKLTPLYTLTDYYVMLKAFDNDFINEMKDKYNDFKDKTNAQIFYEWVNSFKYEFGNLFPEPESITIENNTKKLDNLLKLQQLGANTADIEAELNESGIFKQEIDLDGQQPDFDGDGMIGMDEPKKPDSEPPQANGGLSIDSDNPNNFRIDAEVPAGHEWKTLDNGEHVLINSETGDIVAGANYESWIEKYKAKKNGQAGVSKVNKEPKWEDYKNEEDYKQALHDYYNPKPNRTAEETYNDFVEFYKNAKTTDDMYNSLKKIHGNNMWQNMTNFGQLTEEQKRVIKREYALKYLELQKEETPEEYQEALQLWEKDKREDHKGIYQEHLRREKQKASNQKQAEPEPQDTTKNAPSDTDKPKKAMSRAEYLETKKNLNYTKELIDFHKRELEKLHPNDKMNREYEEETIASLEATRQIREQAIADYEKANPPVNAEKTKKEKPKKIGKTYSISYDNETIEKLKTIGKNWKDKRIYFKELDNGYYDLENDKWVTDSPQLTEKALNMAAETESDKTARLEAEKQEAERKAEEERRRRDEERTAKRRVADTVRNRINTPEFEKDFFVAMNKAGMFKDMTIPKGSINEIANNFFTGEELSAWYDTYKNSNDVEASLKDIVFNKAKKELNNIKEMYQPKRWADWLYEEKGIDNGNYSNYPENWRLIEAGIQKPPKNFKMAKETMNNGDAWNKYGDEFNKYKEGVRKEASANIKKYLKEKLSGFGVADTDFKVDSKIVIDNELDNDINIMIDNFIRFVDAKDFDESKIKRDKDGKFAEKNSSGDGKKDIDINTNTLQALALNQKEANKLIIKLEDEGIIEYNDKSDTYKIKTSMRDVIDNESVKNILGDKYDTFKANLERKYDDDDFIETSKKKNSIKVIKIKNSDIYAIHKASDFVRKMENRTDDAITFNNKTQAEDYLKELPKNDLLCGNLKERLQNIMHGKIKKASEQEINEAIKKLPKGQQKTAGYIYNNETIAKDLYDKYFEIAFEEDLKEGESVQGKAKRMVYNDLNNGARTMYGFSSIKEYKRYSKEADAEIINLINNNPYPKTTVYRGESITLDDLNNLEIGKPYSEINQSEIKSSNASYDFKVAMGFAEEVQDEDYINVVHIFNNTKHVKGSNLSYYEEEDECYIDKTEQILDNVYQDKNGLYYCVYKPKED